MRRGFVVEIDILMMEAVDGVEVGNDCVVMISLFPELMESSFLSNLGLKVVDKVDGLISGQQCLGDAVKEACLQLLHPDFCTATVNQKVHKLIVLFCVDGEIKVDSNLTLSFLLYSPINCRKYTCETSKYKYLYIYIDADPIRRKNLQRKPELAHDSNQLNDNFETEYPKKYFSKQSKRKT